MLGQVGIRRQQQSVRQAAVGPAKGNSGAKGLETLSPVEISRAERRVPEAVSRMRVDAEEILRLVLHRLDEMKAEDTSQSIFETNPPSATTWSYPPAGRTAMSGQSPTGSSKICATSAFALRSRARRIAIGC